MELRWVSTGDEQLVTAAGHLFDSIPEPAGISRFLTAPGHHLCVAYVDGVPAGFVTGVEMAHPDKGIEMLLYELGVDEPFRRRGIGAALVAALRERARERSCYGMWVLTDSENLAALRTYAAAGAAGPATHVMFEWPLE
jgi:ribosomal protein S18 acetylase RimI-like enzyme